MNRQTQLNRLSTELSALGVNLTDWTPFVEKYGVFGFQNGDRCVLIINPTTLKPNFNHPLWGERGWWVSIPGQPQGDALRMPPLHYAPAPRPCPYSGRGWVRRMAEDMDRLNAFAS